MRFLPPILLTLFIFYSEVKAQDTVLDSLQQIVMQEDDPASRAKALTTIGMHYFARQVYFDSAYYYAEKGYELAKEYESDNEQARALFYLGTIDNFLGKYESSIDHYNRSITILERLGSVNKVGSAYNNVGGNFFMMQSYDKAIDSYEKALEIASDQKDTLSMGINYMNIGEVLFMKDDLIASRTALEHSLELLEAVGYDPPTGHLFYARTLLALGESDLGAEQARLALTIAEKDSDMYYISEASQVLAQQAYAKKDFENAFLYQQKHTRYKDSLNTAKNINEIEKLKLNFELSKKEEEVAHLSQKNRDRNIIYLLVGVGVVLLFALVTRWYKISRMTREIHDVQKRLVETELKQREFDLKHPAFSGFDAARAQDFEN